jgi:hypothetical protein
MSFMFGSCWGRTTRSLHAQLRDRVGDRREANIAAPEFNAPACGGGALAVVIVLWRVHGRRYGGAADSVACGSAFVICPGRPNCSWCCWSPSVLWCR